MFFFANCDVTMPTICLAMRIPSGHHHPVVQSQSNHNFRIQVLEHRSQFPTSFLHHQQILPHHHPVPFDQILHLRHHPQTILRPQSL